MYIDPASVDCIRLDDDIIAQLKTSEFVCRYCHCIVTYIIILYIVTFVLMHKLIMYLKCVVSGSIS